MSVPHANRLQGTIHVPGDKSISHRGVIFGALAQGTTRLENFLMADDCINTIKIFRQMGIEIDIKGHNTVVVQGKGIYGLSAPKGQLDAGNSGTTARLLMGLLAGQDFDSILTGDDSLRKRPMDRVVIPLRQMGARLMGIENKEFLPITILGKGATLKSIDYTMPVASAQVKSSLILASMYADNSSHIHQPAISRDHTEIMLESFGGRIHTDGETITTYPQPELYGQDLLIPGDISSAAYFLTAALLVPDSEIILKNVGINPTRSGILDVYKAMGASINIERIYSGGKEPSADITVKSSSLKGTVIEGSLIPRLIDELPIIALAATQAEGTTIIKDAEELKVKESDRIDSTVGILKKIGANIESTPDGMIIQGPSPLFGTQLRPGSDHRMVMMATIAGLIAQGSTTIHDANWVNISYPDFFAQIEALRC
ncbi:MAG TPA: 3-phosphoshikimate 1-carboxyvinyltransferase [Clostridiales bacterium]|nr:3-phosphoshikimate 1-carboxyvinyltransferase [Clostridiales bacterium]